MLYFFTPYSFEKRLFEAIDRYMMLLPENADWACIQDGDTAFLCSDFGARIAEYIDRFPGTGLFTCYASRCHYAWQLVEGINQDNDSLLEIKNMADYCDINFKGTAADIDKRIAGHLMVINKGTWMKIRNKLKLSCANKFILGVDTKISYAILNHGLKIRLMKGIYIFHYLRLAEGINYTGHLL